jgi:prepilin-type N-terminal cleavage/methylation domain-containing protein
MRHQPRQRRAFTLIETAIALAIAAILLAGLSSAIVVASKAIPTTNETASRDRLVIDTLGELRTQLRNAQAVNFDEGGSGVRIQLEMKTLGIPGEATKLEYKFENSPETITFKRDSEDEQILITGISSITGSKHEADGLLNAVSIRFIAADTVQHNFEFHASLPNQPESK